MQISVNNKQKMKRYLLILIILLSFTNCLEKEKKAIWYLENNKEKEIRNVFIEKGNYTYPQVYTVRNLKSKNGTSLKIATGEYEIYGDYKLPNEISIPFEGHQVKKKITFKGFTPYSERKHLIKTFSGVLDLENNVISGMLKEDKRAMVFKPYNDVDFQRFKFETHSVEIYGETFVNSIKVTNIYTDKEQILDGFLISTYINQIILEDINFDGYFDLRIRDKSNREIFWAYNLLKDEFEFIIVLNIMECELLSINNIDEYIVCTSHKNDKSNTLKFVPDKNEKGTVYFGIDEF